MEAAQGSYCADFPPPAEPGQFSSLDRLAHRLGAEHAHPSSAAPAPPKPVPPSGGTNNGKYPPSLYAPGAGQGPAPSPGDNGGGGGPPQGNSGGGGGGGGQSAP